MRMTPEQKAAAVDTALEIRKAHGRAWADIARELGVSTTWLAERVKGRDAAPLAGGITPAMVEEAKRHRANGATWRVTARRVGAGNAKRLADTCNGSIKKAPRMRDYARMEGVTALVPDEALTEAVQAFRFGAIDPRQEVRHWLLQRQAGYAISHSATHVLRALGLVGRHSRELSKKGRIYLWLAFK